MECGGGEGREGKGKAAQAAPQGPALLGRRAWRDAHSVPCKRAKLKSAMILTFVEAPAPKPFNPSPSFGGPLNLGHGKHRNGASPGGPICRRFLGAKGKGQ